MDNEQITELIGHARHFRKHHRTHEDYNSLVKPLEMKPIAIPASGILNDANNFAPEKGYIWVIMRITAGGFTAGSVTAYKGTAQDTFLTTFSAAGTTWLEEKALFITDRGRPITFTATGITGTAMVSVEGLSIHQSILGKYLAG